MVEADKTKSEENKNNKKINKEKPEAGKEEKPKIIEKKPKLKKTKAIVNVFNLPVSTKYSVAICKFIKNKKIEEAIADLEKVTIQKIAVPMKGELPHRKGKRMASGKYPKKVSRFFIKLLKSLLANASANELDEPIISEAIANIGSRPYGRFGAVRRKRTHVKITATEKNILEKLNKNKLFRK